MTNGNSTTTNNINQNSNKTSYENQQKILPIKSKTEDHIVHYDKFNDAQGEDWSTWPRRDRLYYMDYIDKKIRPYFCVLHQKPNYENYSADVTGSDYMIEQTWTYKVRTIGNYHFQLHNNFLMLNSTDCIYNCKESDSLERLNLKSGEKIVYPGYRKVMCLDYDKDLRVLQLGYNDSHYALLNLDNSKIIKSSIMAEDCLVNHVSFYDDPKHGKRILLASNQKKIQVFDLNRQDKEACSIETSDFVNHFSFSPKDSIACLTQDALQVELIDLENCKSIKTLHGHKDFGFGSDWHPNGVEFATGNQDLSTRIWDIRSDKNRLVLPSYLTCPTVLKYMNHGKILTAAETKRYVNFYSVERDYKVMERVDYFGELVGISEDPSKTAMYIGMGNFYSDITGGIHCVKFANTYQSTLSDILL